jgi:predicted esterase
VALAAVAVPLPAPDLLGPGATAERVVPRAGPDQAYAAYLPPAYDAGGRFPVLLIMDPRGRAMTALEVFRDGAARFGYILASAYGTRSDATEGDPNGDALRAILPDLEERFAIDPGRLYLAGFSGTARAAWAFAPALGDHLSGIVGFGAGTPGGFAGPFLVPFFGGAGVTDFNYDEVWRLNALLDEAGLPHRIRGYDGGHAWPPPAVGAEAIGWMELQAMRAGRRARDDDLVRGLRAEWEARAEATADRWERALRYREIGEDLEGLADVSDAIARTAALEGTEAVRAAAQRRRGIAERQLRFQQAHQVFLDRFERQEPPPLLGWSLDELDIRALQRRARDDAEPVDANAARRSLNLVFVYASFYQPRDYLASGDAPRALAALQLADALAPGDPGVCYGMARAQAAMGRKKAALASLACAAGVLEKSQVEADPYLAPLRDDPRYREILAALPD